MSYTPQKRPRETIPIFVGVVFLVFGVSVTLLCYQIASAIANSLLSLHDGSPVDRAWRRSATPGLLEIYLFNWTNPEDGHNATIKPKFEEIGPFAFEEIKEKVGVRYNENRTVSYRQKKIWRFIESHSCCNLSTNITTINAVLVTTSHKAQDWSAPTLFTLNIALRALTPDLHVTKNVSQLLFEGYIDHLLGISSYFTSNSNNKFGWYYGKNDSEKFDGYFNVDVTSKGKGLLRRWNTWDETPHFVGECAKVQGSAGEFYPPGQNRNYAMFFSPDMCRAVKLDYEKDVDVNGVTGYRYRAYHRMLDNGTMYPENACFCNGNCLPSGLVNVSACKGGAPSFISMPHFLHADPVYLDNIEGVHPESEKHQLYLVLEPNTGITLEAAARVQFNFHVKPINFMPLINDVPEVMFPVFWTQAKFHASEALTSRLKLLLKLPLIIKCVGLAIVFISSIIMAYGVYLRKTRGDGNATTTSLKEQVPLQIAR